MEENSKVQKETKENKPKELDIKSSTLEDSKPEKPSRKESTKEEPSKSQIVKEVISEKEESNTKAEKKEKEESKDLIASNPEATSIDSKDESISPEIEEQKGQDLSELLSNSITSATVGLTKQFNDLRDSTLELFRNVGRELSGQKTDLKAMSKDFKDFDQKVFHQQGNKNDEIGKATEVGTRGTVQNRGQNRGIYSDQADYSESGGGSPELGSIVTVLGMGAQALNAGWNYFFGDDDKKKEETTPGSVTDNSSSEKPWWKFWDDDEKPKEAESKETSKEIPNKDVIKEEISKTTPESVTDNSSSEKPWWKFWGDDEKPKENKTERKKKSNERQIDRELESEEKRSLYNRVANYISGKTYDELEDLMGFPKGFLKGKYVDDTLADDYRSIKATIYDKENNKVWNHRTFFDEFGNPTNSTLEIIEGEDADVEIKTKGLQDKLLFDEKISWKEAQSKSGGFVDDVKTTVEEKPWWKFWGDDIVKETKTRRLRDDIDGTLYKLNEDELKIMYSRAKEDGIPFDEETEKFFQKRFNYFKKKRERKGTGALEFDETNSDHTHPSKGQVSKPTNSKDTLSDTVGEVKKATEELKVTEKEARKEDEKSKEQVKEVTKGVADTSVTDMSSFRVDSTTPTTTGTPTSPTPAPSLPKAPQQQAAPSGGGGGGGGGTANITIAPTKAEKSQQKDTSSTPSASGSARTPTDNSSIPTTAGETPGGDSSKKIESKNPTIDNNTKNMLEQSTPPASKETTKVIKDEVKVVDKNGAEPDPTSYFTSESFNSVYRGNY